MPEHITKVSEYVANRRVLIRAISSTGTPTVFVRDDAGNDIVDIDLRELIDASYAIGPQEERIKWEERDCEQEEEDAIRGHMESQPTLIVCSRCGTWMSHTANVGWTGDLDLTVDPCDCSKMKAKIVAQREYCEDNNVPHFAQKRVCSSCKKPWTLCGPDEKITLEQAGTMHITHCPHCPESWCD